MVVLQLVPLAHDSRRVSDLVFGQGIVPVYVPSG